MRTQSLGLRQRHAHQGGAIDSATESETTSAAAAVIVPVPETTGQVGYEPDTLDVWLQFVV